MKMRVADYVIKFLYDKGVKHIFTLSGGGVMYLDDAIVKHGKMQYICNNHEQASIFAADTYSRITENFGAAIVTTGPGATNTLTGVFEAWVDSTPCIVISGQTNLKETVQYSQQENFRQFGVFEVNSIPMVKNITKYAVMVDDPEKIKYYLEKAYYYAKKGRQGPVWIEIPLDIQGATINDARLKGFKPNKADLPQPKVSNIELKKVVNLLKKAKKPVLLAGNGIRLANALPEFTQLIHQLKIPVVTSIMGTDLIAENNPFFVGKVGHRGTRSGNLIIQNSDLVLCIGSRLSIQVSGYNYKDFAPNATKIVVDIDAVEHKKNTVPIDFFLHADAKDFLSMLLKQKIVLNLKNNWLENGKKLHLKYPVNLPEYSHPKDLVNIYYLVDQISQYLGKKDIVITDAGAPYYIVRQAINVKEGQRIIIAGGTGTMGFNLPASTGASMAVGKKRVICITGDGSLQTNIHELATIAHNKLPIKIFVINNNGYISIKNTQNNYFDGRQMGVNSQSGVSIPPTKKLASTYGIRYKKIKNNSDLVKNLSKILKEDGPTLIEVMSRQDQKIIPTVGSKKLPDGKMTSSGIDDMAPHLSEEEMQEIKKLLS